IGCPDAVWFDNYIIAEVPADAQTGGVKIITSKGLVSNEKTFKVNNNPLGAGLCALQDLSGAPKPNGSPTDPIKAIGVRFDAVQGQNNLVFNERQNAVITDLANWTDSGIISTIPVSAVSGQVLVNKKVEAGRKCVGFAIASWCPSNKYDIIYKDAPSNSLPLQILNICSSGYYGTLEAREKGFPVETFTRAGNADNGSKTEFSDLNMGALASDGTYLYTMYNNTSHSGYTFYGKLPEDNEMTIWKIGSGYNGTELGRVYKKYQYQQNASGQYIVNYPDDPTPGDQFLTAPMPTNSLIYTPNGFYVGFQNHILWRTWLPTTHKDYKKNWWGIAKIKFNEADSTYVWDMQEIPQGLIVYWSTSWPTTVNTYWSYYDNRMVIKYTGSNILVIGYNDNASGMTIQVLNNDWKQVGLVSVKNAEPNSTLPNWFNFFHASYPQGIADEQYFYNFYVNSVSILDWSKGEWVGAYTNFAWYTGEQQGAYDWKNQKYWFGTNRNDYPLYSAGWGASTIDYYRKVVPYDDPSVPHHNRLYRYDKCQASITGFCRSDTDCQQGVMCTRSRCENGLCTPEIRSFSPLKGAVGTWMTISGCHFGCQPGQVYFNGGLSTDQIPTNGLVAGYTFNSTDNKGLFRSSLSNPDISSELKNDATISNGVLNVTLTGYMDLDNRLNQAQYFGSADNGKMTLLLKVKADSFAGTNLIGLTYCLSGTIFFTIYPTTADQTTLVAYIKTSSGDRYAYSVGQIRRAEWNNIAFVMEAGIGYKIYINGKLTDDVPLPELKLYNWNGDTQLGNQYSKFVGQLDDFFIYNRALSSQEIAQVASGAKGLELADPACWPNWNCSTTGGYDEVTVEVPNRRTLSNLADDALTGAIKLITAQGLIDTSNDLPNNPDGTPKTSPIFTVNTDPLGPQICKLIPNYGNRKINVRIYGENFGSAPATGADGDYVTFEPTDATIREPFLDYGEDGKSNSEETGYDPINIPDPAGDDFNGSAGTEGNHIYNAGEPFIDFANSNVYDLNLNGASYISIIKSFVKKAIWPSCPQNGWDDKNICFSVPDNAAGFGTGAETALNKVSVTKGEQQSGEKQFEVTFGFCGNQKIEPDKGEMCDGSLMPTISPTELTKICTELFSPLYPDDEISSCYAECNTGCNLSLCIGSNCKTIKNLCGNNKIEEFYSVNTTSFYHEQCDTTTFPPGLTCSQAGYPNDKICASGDKQGEPCSSADQCSSTKICVGGTTPDIPCTANSECGVGGSCQGDIACTQACTFECSECQLLVCDADGLNCELLLEKTCGNDELNVNEECDCGADGTCSSEELNGKTCNDFGRALGTLACYPPQNPIGYNNCRFNTDGCSSPVIGPACNADSDCLACGADTSKCVNGFCTPYITDFTPTDGKIGTWTTLTGCYFGCDQGKVFFQGDKLIALPAENKVGLLAGYIFEEDGQVKDLSGHNYDGILTSGASVSDGVLSLDGTNDYVDLGNLNDPDLYNNYGKEGGKMTFVAKIKWTAPTGADANRLDTLGIHFGALEILVINGNDGKIGIYTPGNLNWIFSANTIKSGEWSEIAIVAVENSGIQIYINGVLDSDISRVVKFSETKTSISTLGQTYGNPEWYRNFGGQIDQALIYNRILSGDEIANLYKLTHQQGLKPGDACPANWLCHKSCSGKFCVGGDNATKLCATDANCPGGGSCLSNSRECTADAQCKVCLSGTKAGELCSTNEDCPLAPCGADTCRPDWIGDKALMEVPDKNTSAITDDARTGPINLVTSYNLQNDTQHLPNLTPPLPADFTVSDTIRPQICLAAEQIKVESTNPVDKDATASTLVCRNAKINIYFDKIIDQKKINKTNFLLSICPSGLITAKNDESQGMINKAIAFVFDIVQKLIGIKKDVSAQSGCTQVADYKLEIENSGATKVSIVPKGLLNPEQVYGVTILGGVVGITGIDGAFLDYSNSPKRIKIAGTDMEAYIFEFTTMGNQGDSTSGICNVDWIDVSVYRKAPVAGIKQSELRNNDLFICAGKNNCQLAADYDQDTAKAGNQHIYKAIAKYNGSQELQATFQWSKTDTSDPQKAINISNDYGLCTSGAATIDICTKNADCGSGGVCDMTLGDIIKDDDYKVKNDTGVTFATAAALKEGVSKLVIEAQALGSTVSAQKEFTVYILLCENPWPGIDEKFPISSIINAYNFQTYYCRDAATPGGPLLPAARWLAPKEGKLNILQNTDFEFGNLTYWADLTGTAFNSQPVFRDLPRERGGASAGIQGAWWINTSERYRGQPWENINVVQGLTPTGILQSAAFVIEGDKLEFKIGGSNNPWPNGDSGYDTPDPGVTAVVLFTKDSNSSDFTYAMSATGSGSQTMAKQTWIVTPFKQNPGITGIIYIYDNNTGGYISFDDLRQYNTVGGIDIEIPIRF
ncbi:MAG: hypothetical protein NTX82_01880, partial [Candidatus Parcubacteria bacterium]|nr:hypothetical protein [Candidatus Parcubacteria bacterium]